VKRLAGILLCSLAVAPVWADPGAALAAALADCRRLPTDVRTQARYLSLENLPEDYRPEALKVLAFQVNSLSRSPDLVAPKVVSAGLVRVLLVDYGWDRKVWEKLADVDPYYHVQVKEQWPGGVDPRYGRYFPAGTYRYPAPAPWLDAACAADLYRLTDSETPVVRADWWFVQGVRQLSLTNKQTGVGYYDWLGLKDRKDFERLIRLSAKDSRDLGKETRAALERSGVAQQGRQVVRFQALTGGAWVSLDTDDNTGEGNPVRNLRGGDYVHKAEEHYGVLPNGLFAFFLCDDKGARQDTAPDFIGPDDSPLRSGRDARIHVGLGCVRCHVEGLRGIDDWVRRQPKVISSPDYRELLTLRRQYLSNLARQLERDRAVYAEALAECNGLKPAENARAVARFWDRYVEQPVGPKEAAAELGVAVETLRERLSGNGDLLLAGLAAEPPVPLRREHFEEIFPVLAPIVYGGAK
jgi:hypothetical protein